MVYSIAYDAVKIKTEQFDPPVSLISDTELAAAIALGYRQAGMACPQFDRDACPEDCRQQVLTELQGTGVHPKLYEVLERYESRAESWSDDAYGVLYYEETGEKEDA